MSMTLLQALGLYIKSLVLILFFIVGKEKRKAEAMAMEKQKGTIADKGKKKITTAGNGKENLCPTVPNNNVTSKAALAQRARRDRERNERLMSASPRERGQQLRREREQFIQPLEPVYFPPLTPCRRAYSCLEQQTNQTNVNPLASKRQLVTHTSICPTSVPSTSYGPQRPTPTSELLQDHACTNDDVEGVPPRVTQPFICSTSILSTSYAPQRPTPTSELFQEDACSEDGMEGFPSRVNAQCPTSPCRHFLGKMNVLCPDCKAWHWMDEKLTKSSKKNPLFGTCCLQGKVRLPLLITPPPPLQALYDGNDDQSKSFRTHTREYNAANAFMSLGATLDTRVLSGRGPTSFTIHGELRHRTGSLLPVPGQHASYAQLYIYDPNSAVEVRTHRKPHLRRDVLQTIQDSLLQVNAFVGKFRHAYAVLNQLASTGQNLPAHLHYSSSKDRRRYNVPTTDEIAVVIPGDGTEAELFRQTKLIIWDEVPMQHKHCVEAVDRTLRDICNCEKPFGGITVVLGGDFRQILPVITKGVREQIVNASLRHSVLWKEINVLTLNVNMRLDQADQGNANFAKFLLEIGTNPQETIKLPPTIQKCQDLNELLSMVYPQLHVVGTSTPKFLTERTILSARNEDVSSINIAAKNIFPGEVFTFLAADRICEEDKIDRTITNRYPNEFLNSLDPPGLPPFKVELKVGCPIMLLRNIAPKAGLCNCTRLMVVRCASRIIKALILSGEKFGNLAFIPRITLTPSSSEFPFRMTRRQFPIRLAYALTINKSQGQSVKFVGVDLRTPVFSHGQLYVALSRCTSFDRISVLLSKDELNSTTNIVYLEVLL